MTTYHGNRNVSAFNDMVAAIDFDALRRTITWDEGIDINALLQSVILEGAPPVGADVQLTIYGGNKLQIIPSCLAEFERKHHYLSQPSRIRESMRSALGVAAVAKAIPAGHSGSFMDYCGRMGVSSALITGVLKTKRHIINEEEDVWADQLRLNFPRAKIGTMPVRESLAKAKAAEVALIDYCSWIPSRDIADIIPALKVGHGAIILTDASPFFWHINRDSYCRGLFTAPLLHTDYIAALSDYLSKNFGYHIAYSVKRSTIVTHLFLPGKQKYKGKQVNYGELYKMSERGFSIHIGMPTK